MPAILNICIFIAEICNFSEKRDPLFYIFRHYFTALPQRTGLHIVINFKVFSFTPFLLDNLHAILGKIIFELSWSYEISRTTLKSFHTNGPHNTLYQNCTNAYTQLNTRAARALDKKSFKRHLLLTHLFKLQIMSQKCFK